MKSSDGHLPMEGDRCLVSSNLRFLGRPFPLIAAIEARALERLSVRSRALRFSMRLWIDEPGGKLKVPPSREYETVGYVISGSAKLELEGQTLHLKPGDSWLVPAGAMHQYTIIELFTAVEATAPPAEVHGRDTPA